MTGARLPLGQREPFRARLELQQARLRGVSLSPTSTWPAIAGSSDGCCADAMTGMQQTASATIPPMSTASPAAAFAAPRLRRARKGVMTTRFETTPIIASCVSLSVSRDSDLRDASELLWNCWEQGRRLLSIPEDIRPQTREEGYAVQALLEQRSAGPLFGWKIAATSAAGQAHINVTGPLAGRLLREKVADLSRPGTSSGTSVRRQSHARGRGGVRLSHGR